MRKKQGVVMQLDFTAYDTVQQRVPTRYFIGGTRGLSSIMRIFPLWAEVLGLNHAQLVGVALPLHAAPEQYRQAVAQIKDDPLSLGALITTHKIDLLHATSHMFDSLDRNAHLCQEVSCIAKRDSQLIAYAKDPINSALPFHQIIDPRYWTLSRAQALSL